MSVEIRHFSGVGCLLLPCFEARSFISATALHEECRSTNPAFCVGWNMARLVQCVLLCPKLSPQPTVGFGSGENHVHWMSTGHNSGKDKLKPVGCGWGFFPQRGEDCESNTVNWPYR